jgi:GGDEF domain-containing protein
VVNSSLFGLTRSVSDLNQALALLGTKPLKMLVLGFSLPSDMFSGIGAEALGRYWRHTLVKAVAARELAETVWRQPGDEAFLAGLLQDLGMLLLLQQLGEPYVRFVDRVAAEGRDLLTLEQRTLGFDHTTLTARLLEHWQLPASLVAAVEGTAPEPHAAPRSHCPADLLHLAELFARLLGDEQPGVLGELLRSAAAYGLTQHEIDLLAAELQEKVKGLADVLSVRLPEGTDHRELMLRAYRQLASAAEQAALEMIDSGPGLDGEEQKLLSALEGLVRAPARILSRPRPETTAGTRAAGSGTLAAEPSAVGPVTAVADPGVEGRLSDAVAACRLSRCALSLMLVQLENADELVLRYGLGGFQRLERSLEAACRSAEQPGATVWPYGEAGCAVILPDCDRRAAVELAQQLLGRVRQSGATPAVAGQPPLRLSIGLATVSLPPKNFPPGDLMSAAARCLYGSHASGGGVVKSIEIY